MKCIRAEGASPLVELQKLLFLQRGAEIHPAEKEREAHTKETKRKHGNAVETEKGSRENREQEAHRGGGGGVTDNKRLLKVRGSKTKD